jgi:hypothetical protein
MYPPILRTVDRDADHLRRSRWEVESYCLRRVIHLSEGSVVAPDRRERMSPHST